MSHQHHPAVTRDASLPPRQQTSASPSVIPTLFPIEDDVRDWTEAACLTLVALGICYFWAHFAVAAARGLLS